MVYGRHHVWSLLVLLSSTCWLGCSSTLSQHGGEGSYDHRALPIIEPDSGDTKLILAKGGLDAISKLETPIAAVAVIGAYRSGKSFLLNQLLSLSCEEGFGVGHMRDTKTKGIWVWSKPLEMDIGGVRTSILFLDTEGFESVGKSNVYDDRIFALATIMSSVLIYNLPETVREADISRLSFAVELAQGFYGRVKGRDIAFQPAKLLWLIQRDFLEGKTVQQMVNEALQQVPNPTGNKNIEQVNQIRESLEIMGENSTAFSLPQPHLLRTKLCNLPDSDLDPSYIKRREELKGLVTSMIQPKMVRGKFLNGKEFVSFLEQILEALNKGDIPSTVSLVEVFNKGVVDQCLKLYNDMISSVSLPLSEDLFREVHEESKTKVMGVFEEQRFGRHHAKTSVERLESEIQKIYANLYLKNEYESEKLCGGLYTSCHDKVDELQELRLPSMAKFNAGFTQCNRSFEEDCHGPSKAVYEKRIEKMLGKSRLQFNKDYNNRLFNWLVRFSLVMVEGFFLVMVVVGHFTLQFFLVQAAAASILFIVLGIYTRIFGLGDIHDNPVWPLVVTIWENVVYSPVLDLDRWVIPLAGVPLTFAFLALLWKKEMFRRCIASSVCIPNGEFQSPR